MGLLNDIGARLIRVPRVRPAVRLVVGLSGWRVPNLDSFFVKEHRRRGYRLLRGKGIELGAFNNPATLPSRCSVQYCDVVTKAEALRNFTELAAKDLVDVDYVCNLDADGLSRFADCSFDFVVANHLVEHVANPMRLIGEVFRVLRHGGRAVISAPDKRHTFDEARALTSFDHLLDEYKKGVTEVSDEHYLDYVKGVHPQRLTNPGADVAAVLATLAREGNMHTSGRVRPSVPSCSGPSAKC